MTGPLIVLLALAATGVDIASTFVGGDPPSDLDLHRHSPSDRHILDNMLFPAAKMKTLKT